MAVEQWIQEEGGDKRVVAADCRAAFEAVVVVVAVAVAVVVVGRLTTGTADSLRREEVEACRAVGSVEAEVEGLGKPQAPPAFVGTLALALAWAWAWAWALREAHIAAVLAVAVAVDVAAAAAAAAVV